MYSHYIEGGIMGVLSLFQLFLAVFTLYAIYEGGMKVLIPVLCLGTLFLFERLKGKLKEDEDVRKRYLKNMQDAADRAG